jgi:hypothetical protein
MAKRCPSRPSDRSLRHRPLRTNEYLPSPSLDDGEVGAVRIIRYQACCSGWDHRDGSAGCLGSSAPQALNKARKVFEPQPPPNVRSNRTTERVAIVFVLRIMLPVFASQAGSGGFDMRFVARGRMKTVNQHLNIRSRMQLPIHGRDCSWASWRVLGLSPSAPEHQPP